MTAPGRLTLPIETGLDDQLVGLLERLGADAVRNSDGTELPAIVGELAAKVYATYFVGRGDQEWADAHPSELTRSYLMSERTPALADGDLEIPLMAGWYALQVTPDLGCDVDRWWQVIDRTTGETLPPGTWRVSGEGADTVVTVTGAVAGHVYTVDFLAVQTWDPTQMYNYITNDWADDPSRIRESPFDVRHPATWEHVRSSLDGWLGDHPEVDVVRFTTFFYHFTLVFGPDAKERFVDWFGYSASVSVEAMEQFEEHLGYALTAEDFVDEGYYNSSFRVPTRAFRDWIDFQHRFVTDRVRQLVDAVHASGKEAMMFLGDNWIGTEPYGTLFASTGIDAVVGSVGSGATCRMISDIPGVRYTEGRLLPYFFPDVFHPGGDPVTEANASWLQARRAIVRSPLDRIGYGGYLSLALEHPDFVDRMEQIADEFRAIHDRGEGRRPASAPFRVAILNAWGRLRSWQTHMVAHALWYRQAYSYLGVLEALAGLPFEVDFLSFDDIRDGVPDGVGVLINAGALGTSFSGGSAWGAPRVQAAVRSFVAAGGGLVGVGDPTAHIDGGVTFQLADVLGVDRELGWGLSTNRPFDTVERHFITADLGAGLDVGEGTPDIVAFTRDVEVLAAGRGTVQAAASHYGEGRGVYLAGLPYSHENARLLHRALYWAAGRDSAFGEWIADDPRVEVAHYPESGQFVVLNNTDEHVRTTVRGGGDDWVVELDPYGHAWVETRELRR
ncbi:1,3-beta-galactosyl-N-acetylhexosamine phosphorylase [Tessaracoccus palaemonis]|uniref:1,3-beta-galactosyl-N-acetylhexosamine phosphorylase n=1 Tax=Tessaracoccus palaemonis TaxID=2829499 RepID=A0ABX8SHI0_9ACTN|nr:1,3-beta-galactosyl-N-acetylhexosamine phosphorylase [Tessaracoccus palaemonis]QXT62856.1 1,3-beta-galactosyl-N-acetylhexosamine phosphorylase [Tessaracoccus palaemonis]